MSLRLLHIASLVPMPPNDGGRVAVYHTVRQYLKRNVQIDFAAPRMNANDEVAFRKLVTLHLLEIDTRYKLVGGVANLFSNIPYNIEKYYSQVAREQLIQIVRQKRFDVIQVESLHMAKYATELKQVFHIPIILRQLNFQSEILRRYQETTSNPLLRMYANINYKKMLRYEAETVAEFDVVISITETDNKKLQSISPGVRSLVVPAGVDCDKYYYQRPFFSQSIFFLNQL